MVRLWTWGEQKWKRELEGEGEETVVGMHCMRKGSIFNEKVVFVSIHVRHHLIKKKEKRKARDNYTLHTSTGCERAGIEMTRGPYLGRESDEAGLGTGRKESALQA